MRPWSLLFALAFMATSCTVQTTLLLQPNGAADATAVFRLDASTRGAWTALRNLDDTLPADPFDASFLRKGLGPQGQVATSSDATTVRLAIPDLTKFVPTWKIDGKMWEGTIDRETLRRWSHLTTWSDSPALDSLVPAPGAKITEAEYRELLVYLLGSGVSEAAARSLVGASTVQLTLVAPSPLRSAPGAISVSDRTAVYRWPLSRLLVLDPPIKIQLFF